MQLSRRTLALVVATVVSAALALPTAAVAHGTTAKAGTTPVPAVAAARGRGAEPVLTAAEKAFQADVARGVVPAPNPAAVADSGPQTFTVDSSGDQSDANVGDGSCAISGGGCTLRAAIQEANATTDKDTITFSVDSVAPTTALPAITQPVTIDGGTASATEITGSAIPTTDLTPGLVIEGGNSTLENITINDFDSVGVFLTGLGSDTVTGCHIGTDPSGEQAAPNGTFTSASAGVETDNTGSVIGGSNATDRNTISGNDGFGVFIGSGADNTHVLGNTIGLDKTGTSSVPNRTGVLVSYYTGTSASTEAKNVVVGGPDPGDGNLISGNAKPAGSASTSNYIGLDVLDNGTTVTNNVIGLNADGDPVGNGIGAWVSNAASVAVGAAGQGNVIAGNLTDGVRLEGPGDTGDLVQANDIGTDTDSDPGLGNGGAGVDYFYTSSETGNQAPSGAMIGGAAGLGNVISANGIAGIRLQGPGGNTIAGNLIGTNDAGTEPLHNKQDAIQLAASPNNTIGGTGPGSGNVIGADNAGVLLIGSAATGNKIEGNHIGVDSDGDKLGIGGSGIDLQSQASGNLIGYGVADTPASTCTAACNTISDAAGDGVKLDGTVRRDTIRGNSIFGNKELPIALGDESVEPLANDEHDADNGANGALNFPTGVMSTVQADNAALPGGSTTIVTGTLSPAPASTTSEIVDIYGLTATDDISDPQPAGQVDSWGEARSWLGTATEQPDGTFWMSLTAADVTKYESYSATATDSAGNTSEVSPICMPIDNNLSDDADDDGICDEWETRGVDFDGNGTRDLDLKAYGASPTRRDLFAEVDYFADMAPQRQALVDVQNAFAEAPVSAPDDPSHTGIDLHFGATTDHNILTDDKIDPSASDRAMTQAKLLTIRDGAPSVDCDGLFGSAADRLSKDCWQILGAKHLIWRYVLLADQQAGSARVTGVGDIAGRTAVIMLGVMTSSPADPNALNMPQSVAVAGGWPGECDSYETCLAQTQAAVLMHEFGHTLGLRHGGGDDTIYKPNYLSVMNYNLLYNNIAPGRPLDYSHAVLPDLNENALLETRRVAGSVSAAKIGAWTTTAYQAPQSNGHGGTIPNTCVVRGASIFQTIDWNGNATIGTAPVAESQSSDGVTPYKCNSPIASDGQLVGFDDWASLQYTPVPVAYNSWAWTGPPTSHARTAAASPPPEPNVDPWQAALHADFDGDGIVNAKDDCPAVANASQKPSSVKGIGKACISLIKDRDLAVTMKVTGKAKRGKTLHLKVSVRDSYPLAATHDVVSVKVPHGLKLKSAKASTGKYKKSSGRWTIRKIGAERTVTLTLVVKVTGKLPRTATAELIKAGQKDPNSRPNNHNRYEDDEARKVIRR